MTSKLDWRDDLNATLAIIHGIKVDRYIEEFDGCLYLKGDDIKVKVTGYNKVRIIEDTYGEARKVLEDKGVEIE